MPESILRVSRPLTLTAGAVIEALEALACLGFGVFVAEQAIAGQAKDDTTAFAVAAMMLIATAAMLAITRGLLLRLSWARSPAVLTQLFGLFIAYNLVQSDQPGFGVPLAAASVVGVVALLLPSTTQALFAGDEEPEDGESGS